MSTAAAAAFDFDDFPPRRPGSPVPAMAAATHAAPAYDVPRSRRLGSLIVIGLAHAGLVALIANSLLSHATVTVPREAVPVYVDTHASESRHNAPAELPVVKMNPIVPPPVTVPVVMPEIIQANTAVPAPVAPAAQEAAPSLPAPPKTVTAVEYVKAPQPEYPTMSRRMSEEGKVLLRVLVNEQGHPQEVEVHKSSGSPRLDEAARQAALRALFKPHLEDGRPVAVYAMVPINFKLG